MPRASGKVLGSFKSLPPVRQNPVAKTLSKSLPYSLLGIVIYVYVPMLLKRKPHGDFHNVAGAFRKAILSVEN